MQGCCWSVDNWQSVGHGEVDLDSGCNFRTEYFDVNGGAVVLLERLLFQVVGHGVLDLGSGGNSWRESFDVSGGAWVLLEHRQFAV